MEHEFQRLQYGSYREIVRLLYNGILKYCSGRQRTSSERDFTTRAHAQTVLSETNYGKPNEHCKYVNGLKLGNVTLSACLLPIMEEDCIGTQVCGVYLTQAYDF